MRYYILNFLSFIFIHCLLLTIIFNIIDLQTIFYYFYFSYREAFLIDAKPPQNPRNPISRAVFAALSRTIYGFCEQSSTGLPEYLYGLALRMAESYITYVGGSHSAIHLLSPKRSNVFLIYPMIRQILANQEQHMVEQLTALFTRISRTLIQCAGVFFFTC